MGAYENALREEGSRSDLLTALEKAWVENERLHFERDSYKKTANELAVRVARLETSVSAQEDEHAARALKQLQSGEIEVSHRNRVPLDIERVY